MSIIMECSFFLEVIAPKGLEEVKSEFEALDLGLYIYVSEFNGKGIIKNRMNSKIEIGMDTSTNEKLVGSGYIEANFRESKAIIFRISELFKSVGYPHRIGIDDENGENTEWYSYEYS